MSYFRLQESVSPHEVRISVPADLWISANSRLHWAANAKRVKSLRRLGNTVSRQLGIAWREMERVSIVVTVHRPRAGRADAANAAPTAKAIFDGFTDAKVWADDDDKHITAVTYVAGPPTRRRGWYALTITITEEES